MRVSIGLAALVVTLNAGHALEAGEWMPVVADRRVTETVVDAEGNPTIVREAVGEYLRSSDGVRFILEGEAKPDGSIQPSMATVMDPVEGKFYQVLYGSKRIVEREGRRAEPTVVTADLISRVRAKAIGERAVNGVPCFGLPVESGSDKIQVTGVGWRSLEYDLPVKTVSEFTSEGRTTRIVEELHNIRIGQEPDPSRMRMPPDFSRVALPNSIGVRPACRSCARDQSLRDD